MRLIIDTYNVLHTVGELPDDLAGIDLAGLVALIRRSRYRGHRVDLVCDGTGPGPGAGPRIGPGAGAGAGPGAGAGRGPVGVPGAPAGPAGIPGVGDRLMAVHYSGAAPREADDVIIDMVTRTSHPRRVVVVSSDRRIVQAARRRRCGTLTAAKFLRRLALDYRRPTGEVDPRPRGPLREDEIDEWIREFDLQDHELTMPPDPPVSPARPKPKSKSKSKSKSAARGDQGDQSSTKKKKKGKRRNKRTTDSAQQQLGEVSAKFPDDVLAEADDLTRDGDGDEQSGG